MPSDATDSFGLSPRQQEFLRHRANGLSRSQIASAMGVGSSCIQKYFAETCRKMGKRHPDLSRSVAPVTPRTVRASSLSACAGL